MADKKETAKPGPKAEAQAAGDAEQNKAEGNKKINKMTLAEIDVKLNEVKVAQGFLRSRYAKQLLQRKKALAK
ncbi:MAG: hypothetical protein Q8O91_07450 [Candidatus Aminicenantes bacterium]|nr:hypothetical protein [Candidatus Aminicenantes bacterium]